MSAAFNACMFPEPLMSDTPPDRLSINPASPHFDADVLSRGVGIKFKGVEKTNVDEYCVSEGWVRLSVAGSRDRKGNPMTIKLQGPVEPYFKDVPDSEGEPEADVTASGAE